MLYAFFWIIHRRLNFIFRRFGTLCLFHLHRWIGMKNTYPLMKMEHTVFRNVVLSIQTPGNYPEESIQQLYCFFNLGARWGWVDNATPQPISPRERLGVHDVGSWVAPRAGLNGYGNSRPPPGFDPWMLTARRARKGRSPPPQTHTHST